MKHQQYNSTCVHAHVPYPHLAARLESIVTRQINPELFFSAEALDSMVWEELSAQAHVLHQAGRSCTIHAPFIDLNPGSLDPEIRMITRKRVQQVFQAAEQLRPRVIVFHPGYDDLRYGKNRLEWLKNSIDFWREWLPAAEACDCIIAVENIFEKEPSTLKALLEAIDHPRFRHCFDCGHWNMFSSMPLEEWFAELGEYLAEAHIHDNHGEEDEHLPPGEGLIDFELLFRLLKQSAPQAVWTIEAHSAERMERALKTIKNYC